MAKKGKQKQGSAAPEPKKPPVEVIEEVDEELNGLPADDWGGGGGTEYSVQDPRDARSEERHFNAEEWDRDEDAYLHDSGHQETPASAAVDAASTHHAGKGNGKKGAGKGVSWEDEGGDKGDSWTGGGQVGGSWEDAGGGQGGSWESGGDDRRGDGGGGDSEWDHGARQDGRFEPPTHEVHQDGGFGPPPHGARQDGGFGPPTHGARQDGGFGPPTHGVRQDGGLPPSHGVRQDGGLPPTHGVRQDAGFEPPAHGDSRWKTTSTTWQSSWTEPPAPPRPPPQPAPSSWMKWGEEAKRLPKVTTAAAPSSVGTRNVLSPQQHSQILASLLNQPNQSYSAQQHASNGTYSPWGRPQQIDHHPRDAYAIWGPPQQNEYSPPHGSHAPAGFMQQHEYMTQHDFGRGDWQKDERYGRHQPPQQEQQQGGKKGKKNKQKQKQEQPSDRRRQHQHQTDAWGGGGGGWGEDRGNDWGNDRGKDWGNDWENDRGHSWGNDRGKKDRGNDWGNDRGNDWGNDGGNDWGKNDGGNDWGNDRGNGWGNEQGSGWGNDRGSGWGDDRGNGWGENRGNDWGDDKGNDWGNDRGDGWGNDKGNDWGNDRADGWGNDRGDDWGNDRGNDWGNDARNDWGDDTRNRRKSSSKKNKAQASSPSGPSYSMPSKTMAHANSTIPLPPVQWGSPRNGMNDYADVRFIESDGAALEPANRALFGKARLAKDRIHWMFPSDKDERVASLLGWIQAVSYNLGGFGLHKFLQSRERGALVANADFRSSKATNEPAFDWLTFDQLQHTMDRTLQESVAFYDPAVQVVVFVFLPSKTGNSVAIWRRKINVPNNLRLAYQREISLALAALRHEKDYVVHVDELPKKKKPRVKSSPPKPKRKWWHIFG